MQEIYKQHGVAAWSEDLAFSFYVKQFWFK